MNQTRVSPRFVWLAAASVAAAACGHERETAPSAAGTSVGPAKVVSETTTDIADPSVCITAGQEPASSAGAPPVTREKTARHDEAIRKEEEPSAQQNATPDDDEAVGAEVTTTAATVPRALPPPVFAPVHVAFASRLPDNFRLERVRMLVDGAVSYDAKTAGQVQIPPGEHVVEVIADYRLHDPLFTYVSDYRLEIRSTEIIPASLVPTQFVASALPRGNATTPMSKRASLSWGSLAAR
jgi:hypothetical protein